MEAVVVGKRFVVVVGVVAAAAAAVVAEHIAMGKNISLNNF